MEGTIKQKRLAKDVFNTLCDYFDKKNVRYSKDKSNLRAELDMIGDDLIIKLSIRVRPEIGALFLESPMPFRVSEDFVVQMAVAVSFVNTHLYDGCFELNCLTGKLGFRMSLVFENSIIGEDALENMIAAACQSVDAYNDKFLTISQKTMSPKEIEDFLR